MKVVFPKWHEDARRLREEGIPVGRIPDIIAQLHPGVTVSASRVSQVTNKNWQIYAAGKMVQPEEGEKAPMADRMFQAVSSPDPTDVFHRVRITCGHEGCKEELIFKKRGPISHTHAAQWFRNKGWSVGGGFKADRCPDHSFKARPNGKHVPSIKEAVEDAYDKHPKIMEELTKADQETIVHKHTEINTETKPPVKSDAVMEAFSRVQRAATLAPVPKEEPKPETWTEAVAKIEVRTAPPEELTKSDKRIIIAELNDCYIDETTGYKGDFTDEKVAKSLGVPKEWVAYVREENFGPEYNEAEHKARVEKLHGMAASLDEKLTRVTLTVDRLNTAVTTYEERAEQFTKFMEELDKKIDDFHLNFKAIKEELVSFQSEMAVLKERA